MANRHKAQRSGVGSDTVVYGNPKVIAAAKARKRGGRADAKVDGEKSGPRLDKRARGGRTGGGADKSPFSSAGSFNRGG